MEPHPGKEKGCIEMAFQQDQLLQAALRTGYPVIATDGWETRGNINFNPGGGVWHHTAAHTNPYDDVDDHPSLGICVRGRAGLPGPLCNFLIGDYGTIYLIAAGTANHGGRVSSAEVHRMTTGQPYTGERSRGEASYNSQLIGIEVENDGVGSPYPERQIKSLVSLTVELDKVYGWTIHHWRHHKELTTRKIDMSYEGDLRLLARQYVANTITTKLEDSKDMAQIFRVAKAVNGGPIPTEVLIVWYGPEWKPLTLFEYNEILAAGIAQRKVSYPVLSVDFLNSNLKHRLDAPGAALNV